MTTGWLLLLVLFVSSQSVDSQSTTDDETCSDGGVLSELKTLLNSQHLQLQRVMNRLGKLWQKRNCRAYI